MSLEKMIAWACAPVTLAGVRFGTVFTVAIGALELGRIAGTHLAGGSRLAVGKAMSDLGQRVAADKNGDGVLTHSNCLGFVVVV